MSSPCYFLLAVIISLSSAAALFAEKSAAAGFDEYRPEKILSFARYLTVNREYYRAYVELNRLDSFFPNYLNRETSYITGQFLLLQGRRYRDVIGRKFTEVSGRANCADIIFKSDAKMCLSDPGGALLEAEKISGQSCETAVKLYSWKRAYLANILLGRIDTAEKMLIDGTAHPGADQIEKYRAVLNYAKDRREKITNPYVAMTAGIIPGLGYIYAGSRPTGIIAFAVVAAFSAITYAAFRTDNKPAGVFFGASAAFFYAGNIAGGYMTSMKNNRMIKDNMRDSLMDDMSLNDDRERLLNEYGIMNGRYGDKH
jgi:hypothetical protein